MNKLRIGIDLSVLSEGYKGGVGRYSLALTKALIDISDKYGIRISVICSRDNLDYVKKEMAGRKFELILNRNFGTYYYNKIHSFAYKLHYFPGILDLARKFLNGQLIQKTAHLDLIYCPTTYLNYATNQYTVVSLHDTQEVSLPENFTKKQKRYRKLNRNFTIKNANVIQVSSEFIKQEIVHLCVKKNKETHFFVLREGVDTKFFDFQLQSRNLLENLIIVVPANFVHHKNHSLIIQAISNIITDFSIYVFFIGEGDQISRCESSISKVENKQVKYIFRGKISDEEIKEVYSSSHVVLSASSYESSSLPLLEGLSSGCIPIASNIPAHLEMAKIYPILLFDLQSPSSLNDCIQDVIHNSDFTVGALAKRRDSVLNSDWSYISMEYIMKFRELLGS